MTNSLHGKYIVNDSFTFLKWRLTKICLTKASIAACIVNNVVYSNSPAGNQIKMQQTQQPSCFMRCMLQGNELLYSLPVTNGLWAWNSQSKSINETI